MLIKYYFWAWKECIGNKCERCFYWNLRLLPSLNSEVFQHFHSFLYSFVLWYKPFLLVIGGCAFWNTFLRHFIIKTNLFYFLNHWKTVFWKSARTIDWFNKSAFLNLRLNGFLCQFMYKLIFISFDRNLVFTNIVRFLNLLFFDLGFQRWMTLRNREMMRRFFFE